MQDLVRLQVKKDNTENTWEDVGHKTGNESVPVNLKDTSGNSVKIKENTNAFKLTSMQSIY